MKAGDIVTRAYQLSIFHNLLGLVIDRDNCGYLTVIWGDKVRAAFENNMYTKSKSARVYIDNKSYEISGERMKELGVNPYAKPLN